MMKENLRVTLNAKQIREACEAFMDSRIKKETEEAVASVPASLTIDISIRKKRPARKLKATND